MGRTPQSWATSKYHTVPAVPGSTAVTTRIVSMPQPSVHRGIQPRSGSPRPRAPR